MIAVGVVRAGKFIAEAINNHAISLAGYWSTSKAAEAAFVSLDDVVAEWNLENPKSGEMVLETDAPQDEILED